MNLTNKALIQDLFSGRELVRLPFIPIIYRFGAKLCQTSPQEMMEDATTLTNSLLTCQELFGYDAVVSGFDLALHIDGMGYPIPKEGEDLNFTFSIEDLKEIYQIEKIGYFSIAIETIRRLSQMVGKKLGIFGIITGPVTLAYYLGGKVVLEDPFGESSKQFLENSTEVCLKISKAYGEFQIDGIIFFEWVFSNPLIRSIESYCPIYQTLNNVIHFYNSHLIIALPNFDLKQLNSLCQIRPDALILGEQKEGNFDFSDLKELLDRYQVYFGIGIPFYSGKEKMFRTLEWVNKGMEKEKLKRGIFLSSAGEIPYEMEAGDMHDFVETVTQIHL